MENLNAKIDYNKKAKSLWESEWLFRNGGDDEMDKDTVVAVCSLHLLFLLLPLWRLKVL